MPRHILSVDQFDRRFLDDLFADAASLSPRTRYDRLKGRILTNLFYEASSRTSGSFHAAMTRMGGTVIPVQNVQYSSVAKGEDLQDTIRTFGTYSDVIVLRHPEVGAAAAAAEVSEVPVINAGDGIGEHPTQALLDLFTIRRELGRIDNLTITLVGDLKHGRTVHSLVSLLQTHGTNIAFRFVAPDSLRIPYEHRVLPLDYLETDDLDEVISESDVVYMTRAQKERFERDYDHSYGITAGHMARAKPTMVLMHPLPRNGEIPKELDRDPRAAYFRQMENGLRIRMALLSHVLGWRGGFW
jgi:aspartate carbamoyltransferase